MDTLSQQIANLNKRDDDGESDADICGQASDIFDLLKKRKAEAKGNTYQEAAVRNEDTAFILVIQKINAHRHEHALDQFKHYAGSVDWPWYNRVFCNGKRSSWGDSSLCDVTSGPCACGAWHKPKL